MLLTPQPESSNPASTMKSGMRARRRMHTEWLMRHLPMIRLKVRYRYRAMIAMCPYRVSGRRCASLSRADRNLFACKPLRQSTKMPIDRSLIVRGTFMHHGLNSYQLGRHSRRSSRRSCPDPDCQPHCCCAPKGCCDLALSELGKRALPLRAAVVSVLRTTPDSFFRFTPSSRSRLACASCDIRRYWVSMILPFRSTRKHSGNAFPRLLCGSANSGSVDLHASWLLASGDGGTSAAFGAA